MKFTHWTVTKSSNKTQKMSIVKAGLTKPNAKKLLAEIAKKNKSTVEDGIIVITKEYSYSFTPSNKSLDNLISKRK